MAVERSNSTAHREWLTLKFQNSEEPGNDIPLPVLATGLSTLERVIHLLLGTHECPPGETLTQNSGTLRRQFEERFRLSCGQSLVGSYALPVQLRPESRKITKDLFEADRTMDRATLQFKNFVDQVLVTASGSEPQEFIELFDSEQTASRVAKACTGMLPTSNYELELSSNVGSVATIFKSSECRQSLPELVRQIDLDKPKKDSTIERLSVVAKIEALDELNRIYRARTQEGLAITGNIDEDLVEANVTFSPKIVELNGEFEVDEENHIKSVGRIDRSERINKSPIEISNINVNNERLHADPPLKYRVKFNREGYFYTLEGDFGFRLHASSREDLEDLLDETLQDCWIDFALEEDENKLAVSGRRLRRELLSRLEPV